MTEKKNAVHILLHRPTPWVSDIKCSTKIYAEHFRDDGYDVTYLEGLPHLGHLAARRGYYPFWRRTPRWQDGVWIVSAAAVIPFLKIPPFRSSWAARANYFTCVPSIPSLVRRSGRIRPDVIWTAKPGSSALKRLFPNAILIFQVVDYYPAFTGGYIKKTEKQDYERADHVFVIGRALQDYLTGELNIASDKITVLNQGVSLGEYSGEYAEPEDLKPIPRPRAIYVGVLGKCDPSLFEAAASRLQKIGGSLVLIGPAADWVSSMSGKFSNVFALGPKPPDIVPAYLKNSDVGLMLYDLERMIVYRGQNPLKLYQYAAAGLPILSTPHDEFEYIEPPVLEVRSPLDVPKALDAALRKRSDWRLKTMRFAEQYSWSKSFREAESIIRNLLQDKRGTRGR